MKATVMQRVLLMSSAIFSFSTTILSLYFELPAEIAGIPRWYSRALKVTIAHLSIGHFTVKDGNEADRDLVLIQTFLLYHVNQVN